ncbi:MAG: C_GCAxxG_C_C family protein [Acidobacteria bacterium]|nr:C_GCAxxG_C_C family protein [Acidobacteriota bacterium]
MGLADLAVQRFEQGYSCSQAVFSACAETRGVDRDLALRLGAGFSGGLGRTAQTCGCVTGAIMAIGLAQRSVTPEENRAEKDKTCETVRRFLGEFTARNGSTVCRDLLGCDIGTPEGYEHARQSGLFKTRCPQLVRDAVQLVGSVLT